MDDIGHILDDGLFPKKSKDVEFAENSMDFSIGESKVVTASLETDNSREVIGQIRELMIQGKVGKKLRSAISHTITKDDRSKYAKEISALMDNEEGLLGTIVVDASIYGGCRKTAKVLSKNPYKSYAKFIVNCNCGSHQIELKQDVSKISSEIPDDPISDFLNMKASPEEKISIMCPVTQLQVIAGYGELDDSDMSIIDPMTITPMPKGKEVPEFRQSDEKNTKKISKMFISMGNDEMEYSKVPVDNYTIDTGKGEIPVDEATDRIPVPNFDISKAELEVPVEKLPEYKKGDLKVEGMEEDFPPGSMDGFLDPREENTQEVMMSSEAKTADFDIDDEINPDLPNKGLDY